MACAVFAACAIFANAPLNREHARAGSSFYSWGVRLAQQGRHDQAAAKYREALRRRPDLPHAHYNLANTLKRKGLLKESLVHYGKAIRLAADKGWRYVEAWNNLGTTLARQGDLRGATSALREVLRIDPSHAAARANLAKTARAARRRGEPGLADEIERFLRSASPAP